MHDPSAFPHLNQRGARSGGFVLGRTNSFASALSDSGSTDGDGGGGGGGGGSWGFGGGGCGASASGSASSGGFRRSISEGGGGGGGGHGHRRGGSRGSLNGLLLPAAAVPGSRSFEALPELPAGSPPPASPRSAADIPDRPTSAPPAPFAPPLAATTSAETQAALAAAVEAEYRALASGDCSAVLAWLRRLGLQKYAASFQQQAVDGKMLCTLSEADLQSELNVGNSMHRRRLLLEVDQLRAAAPPRPPIPRRDPSEPAPSFSLELVTAPLELKQVQDHVARSIQPGGEFFQVGAVYRVYNPLLDHKHERTARALREPNSNRAVPPQGGYFHGTSPAATALICEHGFDPTRWKGGHFGRGQYLSADASKASPRKYTGASDCRMLLVEACLGNVLPMERGKTRAALTPEGLRELGYDSVAVPDTDEIVVYMRFQAVPRYVVHFERCEPSPPLKAPPRLPVVSYYGGRYEQRLGPADTPLGVGSCTRCLAHDTRAGGAVFLKLVGDPAAAARERAALLAVGAAYAPALLDEFTLEPPPPWPGAATAEAAAAVETGAAQAAPVLVRRQPSTELRSGEVLVLEAAELGESASLTAMCRRNLVYVANGADGADGVDGASGASGVNGALSAPDGAPSRQDSACTSSSSCGSFGSCGSSDRGAHEHSGAVAASMAKAVAQRVLQCVARVHEVGWVHLDLKPEHFMRFPCGQWKLVDYGSAHREGATVAPAHSRRYCAPELAAMVEAAGLHALRQVEPSLDVWAAGALLFALFRGAPLFGDGVSYAEIAAAAASGAVQRATRSCANDAHARLLGAMLASEARLRPAAAELLTKSVWHDPDDTVERRRVQVGPLLLCVLGSWARGWGGTRGAGRGGAGGGDGSGSGLRYALVSPEGSREELQVFMLAPNPTPTPAPTLALALSRWPPSSPTRAATCG